MTFNVLAYNFPHWKTQNGLINLVFNGFKPSSVVLQNRKELNVPASNYRVTPKGEYLLQPSLICQRLGLRDIICDHDDHTNYGADFAIILGARILKRETIDKYPLGIINLHPGILPGNRGLDNLKWSLIKGLPVGVTAHFIDHRIDMGRIIKTKQIEIYKDDTIRDLYIRQRNAEQDLLIEVLRDLEQYGRLPTTPCEYSEKFSAVPEYLDNLLITQSEVRLSV